MTAAVIEVLAGLGAVAVTAGLVVLVDFAAGAFNSARGVRRELTFSPSRVGVAPARGISRASLDALGRINSKVRRSLLTGVGATDLNQQGA